jgi:hypothetical protein
MLPFTEYVPDAGLLGSDEAVSWFLARTVAHSFACFTDPWVVELPALLPKTFVFATGYAPSLFSGYAEACRRDPTWRYHELDGPHWLMMSHPTEVASLVLDA